MTARPPRVFMRTKKPWVRARRTLEGWYVRFMLCVSWLVWLDELVNSQDNPGLSQSFPVSPNPSLVQREKSLKGIGT